MESLYRESLYRESLYRDLTVPGCENKLTARLPQQKDDWSCRHFRVVKGVVRHRELLCILDESFSLDLTTFFFPFQSHTFWHTSCTHKTNEAANLRPSG